MKKDRIKKEKTPALTLALRVVGTGTLLATYTAFLTSSVKAQSSAASNQLSGMITLEDLSEFWFVPAIAIGIMILYLLYENRQRLVSLVSKKKAPSLIETVLSEDEAELLGRSALAKQLSEKQRKREVRVRKVEARARSEWDVGKKIRMALKKILPSGSSPDTVGGQLAIGMALKKSGVAFDLERLVEENKDDRSLISAVVASLQGDFDTIKDKQSKVKSRNKKLAKLEQALEELARLQGTISSERENLAELRRLHAGLDEITADESTTFEALLHEFSEVEQEFTYVSQVCSVIATISAQMRAELATTESKDASFEARKAEIEKIQQNAIRLQQLLTEKRERLSRLLQMITRMHDEIVKASIDDLARLQQVRREEAAIHRERVSELTAQIVKKEGEKKEIEKRLKALDQRRVELEAEKAQRQQRIGQLTADLKAEKKRSETTEAALARAEKVHTEALTEKEKIISNLTEGKRVAEARRDEVARERDAAEEQHRWARMMIDELEEQGQSLRESIGRGTAAIAAAREGLSSKERKFEEEKSALSAAEQERRQAELAAQRRYFEERIGKIQESLDTSRSAMETLSRDLENARKEASAFKGALEIANAAVEEAQGVIDGLTSDLEKKEQEIVRERKAMGKERAKLSQQLSELSKKLSILRTQRERLQSQIVDVVAGNGRLESRLKLLQAQRLKEPKASREVLQQRRELLRNLIALIREERTLRTSAQGNNTQSVDVLSARKENLGMLDAMMQQECDITNAEAQRIRTNIEELGRRHALLERDAADLRSRVAAIQRRLAKEVDEAIKKKLTDKLETLRADGDKLKEDKDRVERELAAASKKLEEQTRENASAERELAKVHAELASIEEEIRRWLEEALLQLQKKEAALDAQRQTTDGERGRADEARRTIEQMEQKQQAVLAQMRTASNTERKQLQKELRAMHEQELETLRNQLARFEGIEAGSARLQAEYPILAKEKKELEERLKRRTNELVAQIDRLKESVRFYSDRAEELEPLVQKTQDQEEELAQLHQDVRSAEALKETVRQALDAARALLVVLQGLGAPQQDAAAAQEAEREAEEARQNNRLIALNTEFHFHLAGARVFDEQGDYGAAFSELELAEKVLEEMPPELAEQLREGIRILREGIAQSQNAVKTVKTVWVLVAVGPKASIRWGYVNKDAKRTAIDATAFDLESMFPDLTDMLSVGFVLSSEKLINDGIKIGKAPSASDIIIPSMKIGQMHLGLKLRKDSSELLVVSNNASTRRARTEDKAWEILPQGTTAALQSANQFVLGPAYTDSPVRFILAPIAVEPGQELYRLSDAPFSKFWISFTAPTKESPPMQQVELPQEVGVLVPKTGNYDVKIMCCGRLVEEIILYKKEHTLGRNPEADIFITAQHKDDIRTISKRDCIIEQGKDGNYSIKLVKEDPYGGVFILATQKEGKSREEVTRYRKVEGALALSDGIEFCLDREGEFCFVFSKKKHSDIKVAPDLTKPVQQEIHYGEAKQQRIVGVLKPKGEFEILVDNKKLSTDRIMLWKDSTLIGKNPDCDVKIVAPTFISNPKGEGLVDGSSAISRHQAVITYKDGKCELTDNSTYGTFVQGQLVGKGDTVTLHDDFLIFFASTAMTVEFTTRQIPESEVPKEVKQATLVFMQKPAPAPEPARSLTKEEETRRRLESMQVNAIFVQQANADVVVDGQPLGDPKRLLISKTVLSIGAKETNDLVLRCDIPKLQSLLRDEQARIEIKPNGEVYLVVLRQFLKGNKVFIDGKAVETRGERAIKIVPDLVHEKKTFVRIGFSDPSIELVYNIAALKAIPKASREWKQAIVSFKAVQ